MDIIDAIKKGLVSEFTNTITLDRLLLSLITAFLIALFIVYIYKKTYSGVAYSKTFAMLIILITMVTALVIRTISSNLALSLGMVGALSIVRFRTAVKDPIDTGFVFWGITAGIMAGVGVYIVAFISSMTLGILFFISYLFGFRVGSQYLLILKFDQRALEKVKATMKKGPKHTLRSKQIAHGQVELTFDIDYKEGKDAFVEQFNSIDGVSSVSLISYHNDFGL